MIKTSRNFFAFRHSNAAPGLLLVALLLCVQVFAILHKTTHHHLLTNHCPICSVIDRAVTDDSAVVIVCQAAIYFLLAISAETIISIILSFSTFTTIRAPPAPR